jgi:hypothetical protein
MKLLGFIFLAAMVGAALMALGVILGSIITKPTRRELERGTKHETQVH